MNKAQEQLTALTFLRRARNLARVDGDNDANGTDWIVRIARPGHDVMVAELFRIAPERDGNFGG